MVDLRPPPCTIHAACGGCSAMAQSEDQQRQAKGAKVAELLGRPVDRVVPSPRDLGYRARIHLKLGPEGRLGYHQPRSHTHVPVPTCVIARPELDAVLQALPPLPPVPGLAVELRSDGRQVVVAVSAGAPPKRGRRRGGKTRLPAPLLAALRGISHPQVQGVALMGKRLVGDVRTRLQVAGIAHDLGPGAFYQVNLELNELLVQAVGAAVAQVGGQQVLDLYAGSGNLSLPLAAAGTGVLAIESSGGAVDSGAGTAERLGVPARFRRQDVGKWRGGEDFFDVAILDPPRVGAPGVLAQLMLTRPGRIIYVSCNPSALRRDLTAVRDRGYEISQLSVFDMFPQTPHCEVLCVLDRTKGA